MRLWIVAAALLILIPVFVTCIMLTERLRYIRELRAKAAETSRLSRRLNLALTTSKVGVWELDLDNDVEIWDARTNELYGFPPEPGARTPAQWEAAIHPEDRARARQDFSTLIADGDYSSDFRVLLPDGQVRHVRSVGTRYAEPGQPVRVLGVNWDVTQDVLFNEDLQRAQQMTEARNRELEAARDRIEHNALHDSLTGLPNRRYLDEMLRRHSDSGYLGSGSIALLHIDLDRFKQINDTLGHAAGDAMLVHAARVLVANCREGDFVARIGGDEFVVLSAAPNGDAGLAALAGRLVEEMRKPVMHKGHECRTGISVGIAVAYAPDIDGAQLLINADIALYRAKGRGRNRHEFFTDALQQEIFTTKRIADDILKGLDEHEFVAYYQPQFSAQTHDLVGAEALARWRHPREGVKSPDAFLDVAEDLNVAATIDRIVLEQALADQSDWDRRGLVVPHVSVNVSLRRLNDETLTDSLRRLGITPGRISFELVESIYLDESEGIVGWNIDRIKELGIDIEIDDFGTGYASIVSLQRLHPKRLKIDKQLVEPILREPGQRRLVSSIVDIGKALDIQIVAEGVETMEQAAILRDLGCDILQGFAFARPMDREAFEQFMLAESWRAAG